MAWAPKTLDRVMDSPKSELKIIFSCGMKMAYPREHAFLAFGEHADPMAVRRQARCPVCGACQPGKVWV